MQKMAGRLQLPTVQPSKGQRRHLGGRGSGGGLGGRGLGGGFGFGGEGGGGEHWKTESHTRGVCTVSVSS